MDDEKIYEPASNRPLTRLFSFLTSIRFRLVLWYVGITAILLVISGGLLYYTLAQTLYQRDEAQFSSQVMQLGNTVQNWYQVTVQEGKNANRETEVQLTRIQRDQIFEIAQKDLPEGAGAAIYDQNGNLVTSYGAVIGISLEPLNNMVSSYSCQTESKQPEIQVCKMQLLTAQGLPAGSLVVGRQIDSQVILQRVLLNLSLVIPFILIILAIGGYWIASRAMRPVHIITSTARQIGKTDLSRRLNLKKRDELGELAATFDSMLNRLEKLFEHQRRFTADASHELRTPLTIMNVAVNQALTGQRKPDTYEEALSQIERYESALQTVRAENEHISRLVNDLLLLARAETGQALLEKTRVDLSEVVLDVVERLAPLAQAKGLHLSLGELPEVPVTGDRTYLVSMLQNLVENAIKYSSGKGSEVHIECGTGKKDGWCWLRVEDDGPGIASEHLSHLFERFYRITVKRADTEQPEEAPRGSGLGLAIVQWVVKAHGGRILLDSVEGEGSRFEIWLPLRRSDQD